MFESRPVRPILLGAAGLAFLFCAWAGISLLFLPSVSPLANPRASLVITVKDWKGKNHPFVLGPRNRYWTPLSAIPASLRKAVIASEDANFYAHEGVDYEAMREAIKADIRKGKFVRGGSTITQQVAKNVFLSREKTITRKVKEIVLARRIDDVCTKSRILEVYLNVVELGPMIYGIGHGSRYYFGKSPANLTLRESAFLAAMLPGPKVYNPYRKMDRVMRRSDRILRRMAGAHMIPEEDYRVALAEVPNLAGIERKVEKTLASPPPEAPPQSLPAPGTVVPESPGEGAAGPTEAAPLTPAEESPSAAGGEPADVLPPDGENPPAPEVPGR